MEQSRGDEESAEIGAACAAGVRGSRFADLGSRPRNVTEHAAAIGDREPQPQPVCGRGMSRGPGPAEAGPPPCGAHRPPAHVAAKEARGFGGGVGRTRAMRAVMRSAPRGAEGPASAGPGGHLMYPTRFAHHSLDAFESFSRPSASGTPSHASCPEVTASSPNSSVGRCSEPTFSSPKGRHAMGLTETVGSVVPAPRRGNRQPPSRSPSFSASPPRRGSGPSLSCSIASAPWSPGSEGSAPAELASRLRARGRAAANASSSRAFAPRRTTSRYSVR